MRKQGCLTCTRREAGLCEHYTPTPGRCAGADCAHYDPEEPQTMRQLITQKLIKQQRAVYARQRETAASVAHFDRMTGQEGEK
jgi:hypothetical protein